MHTAGVRGSDPIPKNRLRTTAKHRTNKEIQEAYEDRKAAVDAAEVAHKKKPHARGGVELEFYNNLSRRMTDRDDINTGLI